MLLLNWRGDFSCYFCEPNLSFFFSNQQTTPTLSFVGEQGEWNGGFLSLSFFLFFCFDCRKFMHNHRHWAVCLCTRVCCCLLVISFFLSLLFIVLLFWTVRCTHTWHLTRQRRELERDYYCLPSFLLLFYGKKRKKSATIETWNIYLTDYYHQPALRGKICSRL